MVRKRSDKHNQQVIDELAALICYTPTLHASQLITLMLGGQKRKCSGRVHRFDSSVAGHTQTLTPTAISNIKSKDATFHEARIAGMATSYFLIDAF